MNRRFKVGIDLAPIAFRARAPGTATHVEHQARALLGMKVEWDWVLVATPRVLADTPYFRSFNPIMSRDMPLSLHVTFSLGRIWKQTRCDLGLATAFFVPFFGPPVVTNYFDANFLHPIQDFQALSGRLKFRALQALWKFSRRRSKALFIDSNYGRLRMIGADPDNASKWVVAPCGCPPVEDAPGQTPVWAEALEGRAFILYVGAFSENKNQRRLIEAWDQMQRRHEELPTLVLIGPSRPDYLREVIEPMRAQTYRPNEIILPGFVPKEEVAWAFHAAHAYVQPSFAEGFGMPVVEAMSCKIPVACSNSTSLPEVAGDAAILFDPSDIADMAKALEIIVFDEKRRAELKILGHARAKAFTWERHATIVVHRIRDELARLSL